MLVFISDIHLRSGGRVNLSRAGQFSRFWQRIDGARRGEPVTLCFVGDTFDLVRDPAWFKTEHRPYHAMSEALEAQATKMVADTLAAEAEFFKGLKQQVTAGTLKIEFLLGNHDRMLEELPRRAR
jgi:UDP-2,3-diacylglucosamine pyrophosphatase LpxH